MVGWRLFGAQVAAHVLSPVLNLLKTVGKAASVQAGRVLLPQG